MEKLKFAKLKTKKAALFSLRQYHENSQQNVFKDELVASTSLSKNKDIKIQKSEKGNPAATVEKMTHIRWMRNLLKDQIIFKIETFLNFAVNQEKRKEIISKNKVYPKSKSKEICKYANPLVTRWNTIYRKYATGKFKVQTFQRKVCYLYRFFRLLNLTLLVFSAHI